jgi:hypothetical protein
MAKRITIKPRNAGTMTESAFWGMIRSTLRNKSRWWKPRTLALESVRRPYTGSNKRAKWEFKCSVCNKYYMQKEMEVHHLQEVGTLKCANDLPQFVENLFTETGWACLCKQCHLKEHKKLL